MKFQPEKLTKERTKEDVLVKKDQEPSPEGIKEIKIEDKTLILIVGLPGSGKSTLAIKHFPLDAIVSNELQIVY